jgi:hypothetical protein
MWGSPFTARDGPVLQEMEPIACEARWSEVHASFERQHYSSPENHPAAAQEIAKIRAALIKIRQLVKASPSVNWKWLGLETDGRQRRGKKKRPTQAPEWQGAI